MQVSRFAVIGLLSILSTACVTQAQRSFPPPDDYIPIDRLHIASQYVTVEVSKETLAVEANKCVPSLDGNSQNIRHEASSIPSRNIVAFEHASSGNMFVLRQNTAICLHRSSARYPIFAAETFLDTVNPQGVPPDVTDDWYKQIACLIATKGVAKVAYVFGNGNAFVTSYWVETSAQFRLNYSSTFSKSGTWETQNFDARFSHPDMSSVSNTKRSGGSQKSFPLLHQKP